MTPGTINDLSLLRAYRASVFPALDISYKAVCADPDTYRALEMFAAARQRLTERAVATRWRDASVFDPYEQCDRDAHLGEVPA